MYVHVVGSSPTQGSSFFLRKSDCLGCAVLLCLVVCLTLLASFFLPSHLSLKHVHTICVAASFATCWHLFLVMTVCVSLSNLAICKQGEREVESSKSDAVIGNAGWLIKQAPPTHPGISSRFRSSLHGSVVVLHSRVSVPVASNERLLCCLPLHSDQNLFPLTYLWEGRRR